MEVNDNFFSINRLLEFGLSMTIAQQMIKTMNETMQATWVPNQPQQVVAPSFSNPMSYYLILDGNSAGPFNDNELALLVRQGKITKDTLGWVRGMNDWRPVQEIPSILKVIALMPPPVDTKMTRYEME